MATITAKITLSLPSDTDSDKVRVYESATETGTYTLDDTYDYSYGEV